MRAIELANELEVEKEKKLLAAKTTDYKDRTQFERENKRILDQLELDKDIQAFWNRLRATLAIKHLEERQTILVMTDGILELERNKDKISKENLSQETIDRMISLIDRQIQLLEEEIDVRHARSIKDTPQGEVGELAASPQPQPVARRLGGGDTKQG